MKRVAIVGGGISGLAAAVELALRRQAGAVAEFELFEASSRLGGIVGTELEDGFVIEQGADGWVSEKPWARELAIELGLGAELISSNDRQRRTYLAMPRGLVPLPEGMRMMVPTEWSPLLNSELFSTQAKLAYLREPRLAAQLRSSSPGQDESVADFVTRHFGEEAARLVAAPLLSGVLGGDIRRLSVRATMPQFVALEQEHGSLIEGLARARAARLEAPPPLFTSLRQGLGMLVARMAERLPPAQVQLGTAVESIRRDGGCWQLLAGGRRQDFDHLILTVPAAEKARLLAPVSPALAGMHHIEASSAIIVALAYSPARAAGLRIPRGFGVLVPQHEGQASRLLACTFVDQKYPHRVPAGGRLLRAFFGSAPAAALLGEPDDALASLARLELGRLLGPLPEPDFARVRRLPDSLPQYEVGHLERVGALEQTAAGVPGLTLLGNEYRGVGLPDLIRDARAAAAALG